MPKIKNTIAEQDRCFEATQQMVVKSNDLIQKARYELSVQEQRMMLYFITLLSREDDDFKIYSVDIRDLCRMCEIELNNGNYINFITNIKKLKERTIHIVDNRVHKFLSWIERVEVDEKNYTLTFRFDDRMKPYLLQLKERFTQYALENVLFFRSKYSVKIYEYLYSYVNCYDSCYASIDDLKRITNAPECCDDFRFFRTKVLNPAIAEINELTDLNVTMDFQREGRSVKNVIFNIRQKTDDELTATRFHRMFELKSSRKKRKSAPDDTSESTDDA